MAAGPADVRCYLLVVAILAAAFPRLQAAAILLAEVPFQFREGLLWIEVTVPQSDKPLNFLLDTGAGVSVVNLGTAKRIGLKLGREVVVHGVQTMLTGYWQERMSAKVGDVQLPQEYLAVDLEKLSRSCEHPVDGLVGADFFRDRVVQIDFVQERIRLLKPDQTERTEHAVPLRFRPCGMLVPISVDGHEKQWVRLDTGCTSALQWVTSEVRPNQCSRQMAIGLAEVSIPQTQTTVGIGRYKFEKVWTGLHRNRIFLGEAGLLGNGLLCLFETVTIDAGSGQLIFDRLRQAD